MLARLSAPVVKVVDALVGDATNAMRVTVMQGDQKAEAIFVHPCPEWSMRDRGFLFGPIKHRSI